MHFHEIFFQVFDFGKMQRKDAMSKRNVKRFHQFGTEILHLSISNYFDFMILVCMSLIVYERACARACACVCVCVRGVHRV